MNDRRSFGELPEYANDAALTVGRDLFKALRERYPNRDDADYDQIMNTLCVSLICLIRSSCQRDNYPLLIQVVHKILSKNLLEKP